MDDIKQFEPLWGVWKTEALIGEGSYGKVYRAVREEFGRKYYAAVKHISIPTSESQITEAITEGLENDRESIKGYFDAIAQNLMNEISIMNDVKGKTNIVSYEDHMIIPKSSGVGYDIIIRMELLTGLNDILRHKQLTNLDVIRLGIDICSALEICVQKGIVHRDIKPSNIFVSDSGDYKLGDFGVARELEKTVAMSKKGTYIYMAPEVYRGETANFSADIFSLGMVMYRLLNGNRAPFLPVAAKIMPGDNENALARRMSGEAMPAPAFADEELSLVILKATQFDRNKRYASPTEMKKDLLRLGGVVTMERSVPIIADPSSNSLFIKKRAKPENDETVLLFSDDKVIESGDYFGSTGNTSRHIQPNKTPVREMMTGFDPDTTQSFGRFRQGTQNEVQSISWRILDVYGEKALLITEKLINCMEFNDNLVDCTWEMCSLRRWLNGAFFDTAFNREEKERIQAVINNNISGNMKFGVKGSRNTQDKVFILSIEEAEKYFSDDNDRVAAVTAYVKRRGGSFSEKYEINGEKPGWWWLRSPGSRSNCSARVDFFGRVDQLGCLVTNSTVSVRPAIWITL